MKSMIIIKKTICSVVLAITAFGCVGTKVHFADAPIEKMDLTRGRTVSGRASGLQLLLFIPIGINGRQADAYARLKMAAGNDYITDIKIQESWTYAFIGTVYTTAYTAMAYPEKADAVVSPPVRSVVPTQENAVRDDASSDVLNRLKTLKGLLEAGLISQDDYDKRDLIWLKIFKEIMPCNWLVCNIVKQKETF